ncbi:MAG: radical SAM protein [Candidatus Nezhaarchaeales archaeon]
MRYLLKLSKSYLFYKLRRPRPSYVVYCCTARCNLKCVFCEWWKRKVPELDTKTALKLIDDICSFGVSVIDFSGGEPLLRKDVEVLALRAKEYGAYTILSTNGTLIDEERAKRLSKAFDIINVSIDGFEGTHDSTRGVSGTFKRTLKSLETLRSFGAKVGIDLTIYRGNVGEILELFKWLMGKIDFVSFQPVMPYPPCEDLRPNINEVDYLVKGLLELKRQAPSYVAPPNWYIKMLRDYFSYRMPRICDAGSLYFMLDPDGVAYACNQVKSSVMGKIPSQGIRDLWSSQQRLNAIKSTGQCKGCLSQCTTAISIAYRGVFSLEDLRGLLSLAFK